MLKRIIYVSHARKNETDEVPGILKQSRHFNSDFCVTGVLCLLDGVYMHYLEGETSVLNELFKRIVEDDRHQNVTVLDERTIDKRAFPEWTMTLLEWNDRTKAIFRSFTPGVRFDLFASDRTVAAPLVRALIRQPDWKLAICMAG